MLETLDLKPSAWTPVEYPNPGEYVVTHFWTKTENRGSSPKATFIRAIAIGAVPWGKRGARSGQCVDGKIVAKTEDLEDTSYDALLKDLLAHAVHNNPADSNVVTVAGEIALELQDRKVRAKKVATYCPRCHRGHEVAGEQFIRQVKVAWFIRNDEEPRRYANSICLDCIKGVKSAIQEIRKNERAEFEPEEKSKHYPEQVLKVLANSSNGSISIGKFLDPKVYDKPLEVLNSLIDEIK